LHISRNPTVVVIDDDIDLLSATERRLRQDSINILTFSNARKALSYLLAGGVADLLILDITMPEYDGVEFLTDLRLNRINLPIAIMSGWFVETLNLTAQLARLQGFNVIGEFEKPFDAKIVCEILNKLPGRSSNAS
jgi:DNA-binding NtrC family response regulator